MSLRHLFALLARRAERLEQQEQLERRADWRAGQIAAAAINAAGGWRGGLAARPEDFFPHLRQQRGVTDMQQQIAIWRALGARVMRLEHDA
ncbi:MAG TPA: hypothetical protein VF192_10960 [Longimicrobiales bacterium]